MRRPIGLILATILCAVARFPPVALAHFGFDGGHPGSLAVGILVYGGAIAVIGLLLYLAFFGKDSSESGESNQE